MSVSRGRSEPILQRVPLRMSEPRYTRVSGTESEPLGVTGSLIPERAGDHKRAESSERVGLQELERAEGASLAITSVLKDGSEPNLQTWMVLRERAVIP
jgi:hypothetical protein